MIFLLIIVSCAKRGSISGGLKDTIAPVLKVGFPKNYSTSFTGQSIKLTFDEYVKLKDINKQLIISPPIAKKPQILPLTASKTVSINFLDPLEPNTTYSLNFGQSIEDNNEGNPYKQFKYIFSTGTFIDSLSISGNIKDAYNKNQNLKHLTYLDKIRLRTYLLKIYYLMYTLYYCPQMTTIHV